MRCAARPCYAIPSHAIVGRGAVSLLDLIRCDAMRCDVRCPACPGLTQPCAAAQYYFNYCLATVADLDAPDSSMEVPGP
eukprot:1484380-Rhodomonas_salina.3